MSSSDRRKQCLYFSAEMLSEISSEAARQDRSVSWIVQKAWKAARREIKRVSSVNDLSLRPGATSPAKTPTD